MRSVYMDTGGNVWSIRRIGAWFVFLHSDSRLLKIEILFKDTKSVSSGECGGSKLLNQFQPVYIGSPVKLSGTKKAWVHKKVIFLVNRE